MSARNLGPILTHLRSLDDPRLERARQHDLLAIVAITICAVIGGTEAWVDVERDGAAKQDWLRGFLKRPNGVPSPDVFGRVFALAPDRFRAGFAAGVAKVADAVGVGPRVAGGPEVDTPGGPGPGDRGVGPVLRPAGGERPGGRRAGLVVGPGPGRAGARPPSGGVSG